MKRSALLAYTLIEILVATVVIGILFTVGYPSVRDYSRKQKLIAAANLARSDLRSAREKASAGEKPSGCTTPLDSYSFEWSDLDTYQIKANCAGLSAIITKSQDLPSGISVAFLVNVKFKTLAQGADINTSILIRDLYSNKVDIPISVSGGIGELAYIPGGAPPTSSPTPTPCPTCLPLPWQTTDIGTATADSKGIYSSGVFTLASSRYGISSTSDEFRFVYQTLSGNGEIKARVSSISSGSNNHLGGVMIRRSLTPGSEHASSVLTKGNGVKAIYRSSSNGSTTTTTNSGYSAPYWVRVKRSGTTSFTMDRSSNGTSWTLVKSQTISNMTGSVYIGLVAGSGSDGILMSSNIDSVVVTGVATPTPTLTPTPTAPGATATPSSTPVSTPTSTPVSVAIAYSNDTPATKVISGNSLSISTSSNVGAFANSLYLAVIASEGSDTVNSVTGLCPVIWTRVLGVVNIVGNNTNIEVWRCYGSPTTSALVTATFLGNTTSSAISVVRYVGANPTTQIGTISSSKVTTASSTYSRNLTTTKANSIAFGAAYISNRSNTAQNSFIERSEIRGSTGGDGGLAIIDRAIATAQTVNVTGALSSTFTWTVIGVEILD